MSKLITELSKLKKRFTYKRDVDFNGRRDHWRFLPETGNVVGDCEDFSLTIAKATYGSLFKAYRAGCKFTYCEFRGNGHLFLRTPEGCVDNIQARPFEAKELQNYSKMKELWLVVVYTKILYSKIFD